MYHFFKNILDVNGIKVTFEFNIREILNVDELIIVLLNYENASNFPTDNVYAYNQSGVAVWQIQDIKSVYPDRKDPNLYVGISYDMCRGLSATTYLGIIYYLNIKNGNILGYESTK